MKNSYRERIKQLLPQGYVELFGRGEAHEIDCDGGGEAGPATVDAAAGSATPGILETTGQPFGATPKSGLTG